MSSLTVFSRISNRDFRFWAVAIIIYCLNLDLIGHVGRSSGHKKLGNVGHSAWGPILIHVLLSPLYFVLQTGPVGLKSCQHLYREYFFVTWWKKIHKNIPTVCQAFTLLRYICFKMKQWEIGSQHSAHSNKWFQIFQNDGFTVQEMTKLPGSVPDPRTSGGFSSGAGKTKTWWFSQWIFYIYIKYV